MKIFEIIVEASKSRQEAEREFAQLREPPPDPTTPQSPSTGKTHIINRKPKTTKPRQFSTGLSKEQQEYFDLRDRYEDIKNRARAKAASDYQTLPQKLVNFDYGNIINATKDEIGQPISVNIRLANTIAALKERVMALKTYVNNPMLYQKIINDSEYFIDTPTSTIQQSYYDRTQNLGENYNSIV